MAETGLQFGAALVLSLLLLFSGAPTLFPSSKLLRGILVAKCYQERRLFQAFSAFFKINLALERLELKCNQVLVIIFQEGCYIIGEVK